MGILLRIQSQDRPVTESIQTVNPVDISLQDLSLAGTVGGRRLQILPRLSVIKRIDPVQVIYRKFSHKAAGSTENGPGKPGLSLINLHIAVNVHQIRFLDNVGCSREMLRRIFRMRISDSIEAFLLKSPEVLTRIA